METYVPKTRPKTRIAIVGVCGSGKTVLAEALKSRGYQAFSVAQEHSLVPELFRHSHPDLVIYLDASDTTVARRKEAPWDPPLLAQQRQRLKLAREQADIRLDTDGLSPAGLLEKALQALNDRF